MTTIRGKETGIRRRRLLQALAATGIGVPLGLDLIAQSKTKISVPILRDASAILDENFSEERLQIIEVALQRNLDQFQIVRDFEVDDLIEPAPMFIASRYATSASANRASVINDTGDRRNEVSHG
jgi:hypothetical protein